MVGNQKHKMGNCGTTGCGFIGHEQLCDTCPIYLEWEANQKELIE